MRGYKYNVVTRKICRRAASGFCVFNDPVIGIQALLRRIRPFSAHRVLRPFLEAYAVVGDALTQQPADAPFDDGKPIWGDFDAQEIFDNLKGDLRIRPCKIGFAAYFESAGRIELMEQHPDEKPLTISGSKVREALTKGERPDPRILRPEIADILIAYYREKA